jgi:hypothetical protein
MCLCSSSILWVCAHVCPDQQPLCFLTSPTRQLVPTSVANVIYILNLIFQPIPNAIVCPNSLLTQAPSVQNENVGGKIAVRSYNGRDRALVLALTAADDTLAEVFFFFFGVLWVRCFLCEDPFLCCCNMEFLACHLLLFPGPPSLYCCPLGGLN